MKFQKIDSGVIYNVTNEALIGQYKADERFKEVVEKKEPEKKTTTKK